MKNTIPDNPAAPRQRIMSIDALRGFDMLMIIGANRVFYGLDKGAGTQLTGFLAGQFEHPEWFGFHFYDIIMPLFLFVVGAVIPFSLDKRLRVNPDKSGIYLHLLKRVAILWIFGWIVQGGILNLDIDHFHIFSNTLQAIAVGYFFSSVAYLRLSKRGRYILFAACLIVYAVLLTVPIVPGMGRSTLSAPGRNFPLWFDRFIMGKFDDGLEYTWILSGLGFTATVLSGLFAGEIIREGTRRKRTAFILLVLGLSAFAAGLIWNIWLPIVKKVWSSSFVLFSSGISLVLLAMFYWIIDVKGYVRWSYFLRVIGMNAIFAYMVADTINLPGIADQLLYGLKQYAGGYYPVFTALGGFFILYTVLWFFYKNRVYIKI